MKKAMVLGLARSGIAATKLLRLRGWEVWACDSKEREALGAEMDELEKAGAHLLLGEKHPEEKLEGLDALIVSPVIPPTHPVSAGGGVIGDLGGFAAACYMRGIDFYNVPTTLLSQVDSSIGGKTAVDFRGTKNTVGSFYPPKRVLIDPDTLKTLNPRQRNAGMAEVIKMAASFDAELFELLETGSLEDEGLTEVIRRALEIKKRVVEEDPKENGLRKALNFGHTVGHAIESLENGSLLHGECVALGMIPLSHGKARERIRKTLEKWNLPTRYEKAGGSLLPLMKHDKKADKDSITAVVVDEIGSFRFEKMTAEALAEAAEVLK